MVVGMGWLKLSEASRAACAAGRSNCRLKQSQEGAPQRRIDAGPPGCFERFPVGRGDHLLGGAGHHALHHGLQLHHQSQRAGPAQHQPDRRLCPGVHHPGGHQAGRAVYQPRPVLDGRVCCAGRHRGGAAGHRPQPGNRGDGTLAGQGRADLAGDLAGYVLRTGLLHAGDDSHATRPPAARPLASRWSNWRTCRPATSPSSTLSACC